MSTISKKQKGMEASYANHGRQAVHIGKIPSGGTLSKEKYDSDQSYILYRVVDGRAGRTKPGSTVVTTAMDFNILSEKFADKEYFISTVGRLTQGSICFTFTGKSYWGQDKTIIPLKLLD